MDENLKSMRIADRIEVLSANAARKEKFGYFRVYSEDELAEQKEKYFRAKLEIDGYQETLDIAKEQFKLDTEIPRGELKESYKIIKQKGAQVEEDVYLIADQATGTMEYVNEAGVVVFTRRLLSNEKQIMLKVSQDGRD